MRKIIIIAITLISGVLGSCVDVLNLSTDREARLLVVEGFISTQNGPHVVTLQQSAKYGSVFEGVISDVERAQVTVRDDQGRVTFFTETSAGRYETPASFRGQIGSTYTLQIITEDGTSYTSLPERIEPVVAIDSISTNFKAVPARSLDGGVTERTGLEIFAHISDPEDATNYYRWRNSGVYELNTNPAAFTDRFGRSAPKACCDKCWISEQDLSVHIFKDNLSNGRDIVQSIAFVEDDGMRLTEKYHLTIEQHSVSESAFQFLSAIKGQLEIDGDIFDPPPATTRGNIINLNNPDENVIGYFMASDVVETTLFLFPSDLDRLQQVIPIPDDCRLTDPTATTNRPVFW